MLTRTDIAGQRYGMLAAAMRPTIEWARRHAEEMEREALLEAYEAMDERGRRAVFGMMAGYMECAGEEDLADRLEEIADAM